MINTQWPRKAWPHTYTVQLVSHLVPRWTGVVFPCMHLIPCRWLTYTYACRALNTVEANVKWCRVTLSAPSAPGSEAWGHWDSSEVYGGGLGWKRWMAQWHGVRSWTQTMRVISLHGLGALLDVKFPSAVSAPLSWLQYCPVLETFKYILDMRFTLIALSSNNA